MRKGFTLIELLAVIVILAIIALIATPIVLNIIDDVNKNSNVVSMQNIERAAKLYFANQKKAENIVFECNDGICKNGEEILEINSKNSVEGKILIDKIGTITYEDLVINGYNCYKEQDKHVCNKNKVRKVFEGNSIILNTSKESKLLDYNIYGNEEEVGHRTKNLFNIMNISPGLLTMKQIIYVDNYNGFIMGDYFENGFSIGKLSNLCPDLKVGDKFIFNFETNAERDNSNVTYFYLDVYKKSIIKGNVYECTQEMLDSKVLLYRGVTENAYIKNIQFEIDNKVTSYEPYGYKIPVKVSGKNLFDIQTRTLGTLSSGGPNTNKRDFEFNKYYVGLTMNNYYYPHYVKSYSVSNEQITLEVTGNGYGIGIPFKVKPNTKYSIFQEQTYSIGVAFYTSGGEYISDTVHTNFITPENCEIIVVILRPNEINVETIYTNIQLEENDVSTHYESYKGSRANIYIKEPLRCKDEMCDYVDFKNQKVIRYIEKLEDGTLEVLNTRKEEDIELPDILLNQGFNNILIETEVSPSKIELEYYK